MSAGAVGVNGLGHPLLRPDRPTSTYSNMTTSANLGHSRSPFP